MTFGKVGAFGRHQRQKSQGAGRPWRLQRAPWQPLVAVVGVAAALWFAAAPQPDAVGGNGALALRGNGAFALCLRASQDNCVIDGDTIRYRGTKIRLEDIDAPEVFSPKCAAEAALARRATRRLLELINAGPFELLQAGERDLDRYGRKLRTITRHGRSVGDTLIAEGLARRWGGARRSWCREVG
jgi:endonuclease YncB( thermonuclease family)